jgi:hypothetical protein
MPVVGIQTVEHLGCSYTELDLPPTLNAAAVPLKGSLCLKTPFCSVLLHFSHCNLTILGMVNLHSRIGVKESFNAHIRGFCSSL